MAGAKPDGSLARTMDQKPCLPAHCAPGGSGQTCTVFISDDYDTPDGANVRDYVHPFDLAEALFGC